MPAVATGGVVWVLVDGFVAVMGTGLAEVAAAALVTAFTAFLVKIGTNLACKLTNRGVGK